MTNPSVYYIIIWAIKRKFMYLGLKQKNSFQQLSDVFKVDIISVVFNSKEARYRLQSKTLNRIHTIIVLRFLTIIKLLLLYVINIRPTLRKSTVWLRK